MNITKDSVILKFNLQGFDRDDIKINFDDDEINIVAKKDIEKKVSEENFTSYEKSNHNFSYSSQLPRAKEENAVIQFNNGILKITIPRE